MGSAPGGSHSRTPLDGPEQSANRDLVGCFGETVTARRSASPMADRGHVRRAVCSDDSKLGSPRRERQHEVPPPACWSVRVAHGKSSVLTITTLLSRRQRRALIT